MPRGDETPETAAARTGSGGLGRALQFLPVVLLLAYSFYNIGPVFWLVVSSLKDRQDLFTFPPTLVFEPTWAGYQAVFGVGAAAGAASAIGLVEALVNSVVISVSGTVIAVALGSFAGYACSRFAFPGRNDFLFFVLSTRMLPPVAVLVFYHIMFSELGLADTRLGLILIATFINVGLATWIMKGFFDGVSTDIERIAVNCGYSRFYAFRRLVLPQVKGGIAATSGFCFIFAWNEFAFASIISTTQAKTLPVKIASAMGATGLEWTQICAAGTVLILPVVVLFYFLRHYLLMGMTFGVLGRAR